MIQDLKRIIEQVSRDKGIERDVLISTLEEAMRSAARKKFGHDLDLEVAYNDEFGEIEAFQFKEVVDEVTESLLEISLDEGRELDPDCELGDSLGIKLDTDTFGRIAAQSAKQVIIQKMKDAEREMIYEDYKDRIGEVINGIVQRLDRGGITVNLGRAEAVVPYREQVPRETYRRGDRIRALVLDVNRESRGPQIILSRTHPDFLANLFSSEVPEIAEGIVTIMAAVREPGLQRPRHRSGGCLRGHEGISGTKCGPRIARRKNRHHRIQSGSCQVCSKRAVTCCYFQSCHRPDKSAHGSHRS